MVEAAHAIFFKYTSRQVEAGQAAGEARERIPWRKSRNEVNDDTMEVALYDLEQC